MQCGLLLLNVIALECSNFQSYESFQFGQVIIKAHFTRQTNILNPSLIRQIVLLKAYLSYFKKNSSSLDWPPYMIIIFFF